MAKKTRKVKVKKRCCESKPRCRGCPLRPENRKVGKGGRRKAGKAGKRG